MEWDNLQPGLELDKLIAKKVLGWEIHAHKDSIDRSAWWDGNERVFLDYYSTDIRAAWELVEKFRLNVEHWEQTASESGWVAYPAGVDIYWLYGGRYNFFASTAPLAICLAAIKIIDKKNEETKKREEKEKIAYPGYGCRVTFDDMVLVCVRHPNGNQNLKEILNALDNLLGYQLEDDEFIEKAKVEMFKTEGTQNE